jgi:hypothetical protein
MPDKNIVLVSPLLVVGQLVIDIELNQSCRSSMERCVCAIWRGRRLTNLVGCL